MKPDEAKRAALLLKARQDIMDELAPESEYSAEDLAAWKEHSIRPLGITSPTAKRKIMLERSDCDPHDVTVLDVATIMKGLRLLLGEIDAELLALGIEIEK